MGFKKKLLAVLAIIVAGWIATPINEAQIILTLLTGGTAAYSGASLAGTARTSAFTYCLVTVFMQEWDVAERVKRLLRA